jgi:hypothetical protein
MLILGFGVSDVLLGTLVYVCDRCGQNAAHEVVKRVRKFTLFFVPLFPFSTKYATQCTFCGMEQQVTKEQAEQLQLQGAGGPGGQAYGQPQQQPGQQPYQY